MIKGFKEFILRGNVIDLAIAVVIGAAFQKVVDTMVSAIVTPFVNAAGAADSQGLGFFVRSGQENTFVNFSAIINAIIVFLITAAVVYFVFVVPMNKLAERRARGQEPEPEAVSEEVLLLQEIRDELRARR
ncbi:MAG: large conductance mechanosensitive channel protein MscL [Austwickia sp.]|nr:large conductance mechanosensitive channel protein MscL [Actinomycetota bacterium]MCB1253481.1 large conductance mechanosensitive channel protein MscL [Austwickia sp.]MCO5310311.1 large conductance mechanosensitive channel protein MscL [Austwickia sp.]